MNKKKTIKGEKVEKKGKQGEKTKKNQRKIEENTI